MYVLWLCLCVVLILLMSLKLDVRVGPTVHALMFGGYYPGIRIPNHFSTSVTILQYGAYIGDSLAFIILTSRFSRKSAK